MFCRFRVVALISLLLAGVDLCIAGTLYVSLTGDDKNNGKTEETAWRTFTHATEQAKAGDTVYIKAGDYGPERITVRNSGTKDKPIVFQGYQKEPGDNPFPNYKPGDAPDPALMPLLNGKDGTGIAIKLRNKKHVQFKNLALTRYDWGIYPLNCEHIVLDHVFATNCYKEENPSYGVGFYFIASHHSAVRDCIVADASGNNIVALRSNFMVIENCKTYATVEDGIKRPDYGIVIGDSHDCVIRNCLAHNLYPENGGGHGIGIKDQARAAGYRFPHSTNNRIINCVVRNYGESIYVAHEAHHNEFIDCTVISDWRNCSWNWMQGINIRDGAHHNTFRNCRIVGSRYAVTMHDTVEGPKLGDGKPRPQTTHSNSFINCVFSDTQFGFELWSTDSNLFSNCIFSGVDAFMFQFHNTTTKRNIMANCILTGVKGYADPKIRGKGEFGFISCDFWSNGFKMPLGNGNFESDPLFADSGKKDFHIKSRAGRWDPTVRSWVKDDLSSPCIDAGHPGSSFSREPQPNGSSCNVGPHGNTEEASKSLKAEKAKSAVQLNEKFRLQYALSGTAPRRNTLAGNGTLRAENLAWLPDPGESRQTSLKLSGKDERLEITMALDSKTSPKGWLAVDIDPLCDPFRVTSPGGAETPARASGRFLLFRPGQAGIWRIEGLPRKGTLMIPGKFSCKRFRVKFAGGLHTKLVYEHVPGMKKYQFEADDPDADDEAELIVQVEPNTTPLVVKADGEPHEDFDRRGDMIHIRGVLPNVTYQVEKLTAATLPAGE